MSAKHLVFFPKCKLWDKKNLLKKNLVIFYTEIVTYFSIEFGKKTLCREIRAFIFSYTQGKRVPKVSKNSLLRCMYFTLFACAIRQQIKFFRWKLCAENSYKYLTIKLNLLTFTVQNFTKNNYVFSLYSLFPTTYFEQISPNLWPK